MTKQCFVFFQGTLIHGRNHFEFDWRKAVSTINRAQIQDTLAPNQRLFVAANLRQPCHQIKGSFMAAKKTDLAPNQRPFVAANSRQPCHQIKVSYMAAKKTDLAPNQRPFCGGEFKTDFSSPFRKEQRLQLPPFLQVLVRIPNKYDFSFSRKFLHFRGCVSYSLFVDIAIQGWHALRCGSGEWFHVRKPTAKVNRQRNKRA